MTFEVQSLKNGSWFIEVVHQGKDAAIFDAQRLFKSETTTSVRVVEEKFDPATNCYRAKVVFRRSRSAEKAASPVDGPPPHAAMERELGLYEELWRRIVELWNAFLKHLGAFAQTGYYLLLKFVIIIGLGYWLLITIYELLEKL